MPDSAQTTHNNPAEPDVDRQRAIPGTYRVPWTTRMREVFRLYTSRRLLFWFVVGVAGLFIVSAVFLAMNSTASGYKHNDPYGAAVVVLVPSMLLGMLLGYHLRHQFTHARARLMPGFAGPHLAVAGMMVVVFSVGHAALLAWLTGASAVAIVTAALAICALSAWQMYTASAVLGWIYSISLLVGLLNSPEVLGRMIMKYAAGEYPLVAAALFVVAVAIFVVLALRLLLLHEESEEYGRVVALDTVIEVTSSGPVKDQQKYAGRLIERATIGKWFMDWRFNTAIRKLTGEGFWQRIRLWRTVNSVSAFVILALLASAGFILPMSYFTGAAESAVRTTRTTGMLFCLPYFLAFEIMGGGWLRHWRTLGWESLRPTGRSQFVLELFTLVTIDLLIADAGLIFSLFLSLLIVQPQLLTPLFAAGYVLWLLLLLPFSVGMLMWLTSYRNYWIFLAGSYFLFAAPLFLAGFAYVNLQHETNIVWIIALTAAVLLVGTLTLTTAYRRWCRVELA